MLMPRELIRNPQLLPGICVIPLILGCLAPSTCRGHAPGENYVWVNVEEDHLAGRFEINLADLKKRFGVDWDQEGQSRVEAVAASKDQVQEYLLDHFEFVVNGETLPIDFQRTGVFEETGNYAQYFYRTPAADIPDKFTIRNDIFLSREDPLHRSLIVLEYNRKLDAEYGGENAIMVFGPHRTEQELDLRDLPSLLDPSEFVWQGILHIWIGTDHILFLLALLLMSVIVLRDGNWEGVATFKKAFWNVFKIVTVFTIAHSITLSMAALDLIDVNSRLVESLIALSIVLVCLNNIFPRFNDRTWLIIFFFGLFHGMGFASVMGELPFRTVNLVKILLAFNVGVEIGQLAIVAAIFPVIYLMRNWSQYRRVVVIGGSVVIAIVATYWFVERAFGLA